MPIVNHLRVQFHGLGRIEPAVPGPNAENLADAVQFPQAHHQLPDHSVHPGTEAPAGDYGGPDLTRVEVDSLPRAGPVVRDMGTRRGAVGEVVEDVAQDDVGWGDVEFGNGVEEGVVV